jgi:hypothetical protein
MPVYGVSHLGVHNQYVLLQVYEAANLMEQCMLKQFVIINNAPILGVRFYSPLAAESLQPIEGIFCHEFHAIVEGLVWAFVELQSRSQCFMQTINKVNLDMTY